MAWIEAADYLPIECPQCHTSYRLKLATPTWAGLANTYGQAFHDRLQRLHQSPPLQLCAWCLIRGEGARDRRWHELPLGLSVAGHQAGQGPARGQCGVPAVGQGPSPGRRRLHPGCLSCCRL